MRILLLLLCLAFPILSTAQPVAAADAPGIQIVLTDEPCALPEVKNLPYAATWTEKGKVTKGCWAVHPAYPLVMSYWADHTVAVIPGQVIHPLTGV